MARARRPNQISNCPLTAALAAIGGKWKLILIYWLAESPKQFLALHRLMPAISSKVLTDQIRELISDGLVQRHRTGQRPAPVVYSLTDYGRSLVPIVDSVRVWGRGHIDRFDAEPDAESSRDS
jgi:DNA-binding HxlR family transcriptional regulator